ncbi:membrane protein [Ramlibacter tataouinensis]|uniref:Membrane protein n=1 Tax=Ramlibacter tataouinensis TaxID=94132 RepID=A0A127K031_9BURK|nr:membrane protein [Ramlibacter tataouinensis]
MAQESGGWLRRHLPGLLTVVMVALAATFLSEHYGGPQLLYALLFGMALNFLADTPATKAGIAFASRAVLRTGVALLGARITLSQVEATGWRTATLVVVAVIATIGFGAWLGRRLQGSTAVGVLTGGAVAICGASAALALASVLPRDERVQRFTLLTVVGVTVLSTVCMIVYPMLTQLAGLDATSTGIFLGATIHDVAQVVGAGYMVSPQAGDTATLVKLLRVAMLLPVVAVVAMCFRRQAAGRAGQAPSIVPWFLVAFAALMLLSSTDVVPQAATDAMNHASRWCLVIAIAALGTKTSIQQLAQLGWRPVALVVLNTLFLAALVTAGIWFLNGPAA